jgi:hypothetical protein
MFTKEECDIIISYKDFFPIKTTTGGYPGYDKVQYTGWHIINGPETKWMFNRLFSEFTKQTGIELIDFPYRFGLHKYVQGEMFTRHNDSGYQNRIWNIGTNLNDEYTGGDFWLYNPDIILPKTPGEIYTFESTREHEVKMITSGVRWSLIMFIWSEHIKKNKI